jgi:hypothetical protein
MLENVLPYTRRHVPEEWNLDQHNFENLKPREEMAVIYHAHEAQQVSITELSRRSSLASTKCYLGKFSRGIEHTESNSKFLMHPQLRNYSVRFETLAVMTEVCCLWDVSPSDLPTRQ